jgi:hypothetical protein
VSDELTELLATGERAAFHGRPSSGVAPLQRAVELAHGGHREAEATAAAWLLGVCLSSAGHVGAALSVLEPLASSEVSEPERRLFSSLAAATLASVHRQLGRHEDGRAWDERALAVAGNAPEAVFDATLGLAADAIGLGDAATAGERLAAADEQATGRSDWWRQRVRLDWVRAELALLTDEPAAALARAGAAVARAEGSGAPRHVAKGTLFTGVAQLQLGDVDAAVVSLRRAAGLAESLGATPLVWPARAMLGAVVSDTAPQEGARALASAQVVVRQIADGLPATYAADWLARPDIAALLD